MSSSIKTEPGAAVDREDLKQLCADDGPACDEDKLVCPQALWALKLHSHVPALLAELDAKEAEITRLRNDSENWRQSFQNEVGRNVTIGSKLAAANTRASKLVAALRAAENEIHFPGSNKAEGIDIAALIREVLEEVEG